MDWIGLTGGIATGKSTLGRFFAAQGIDVVDADQLARDAVAPQSVGLKAIIERFGADYLNENEELDREKLGALVFSDKEALKDLNNIVHPQVATLAASAAQNIAESGALRMVYEVPLLFESGLENLMAKTIVVICKHQTQLDRLVQRDGFSKNEAQKRIDAQMPLDEKALRADYVIHNDGDLESLHQKGRALWQTICRADR